MISITILGSGNVAQNLFEAFLAKQEVSVVQVVGRKLAKLDYFKEKCNLATYEDELQPADVYIMAISDDAISAVSNALKINGLLVHTSGSVPLCALESHQKIGVFYPLQTFTAGKTLNFENIPICIEANQKDDLELLRDLGTLLSTNVQAITSDERRILHLSAVFVNNFTNYMYAIGHDICTENNLDFSLLQPLIKETAEKIRLVDPYEAQTGPAKRGDQKTLHAQLSLLKNKNYREIYTLLSNSIKASYNIQKGKS